MTRKEDTHSFGILRESIFWSEGERKGMDSKREKRQHGEHGAGEGRRTEAKGGQAGSKDQAVYAKGGWHIGHGHQQKERKG